MQLFPISAVQFLDKIHREMTVIHIDLNKHNIFEVDIREVFDRYKIDLGFFNSISFCPHLIAFKADGEMFINNINEGFFKSISQTSSMRKSDLYSKKFLSAQVYTNAHRKDALHSRNL